MCVLTTKGLWTGGMGLLKFALKHVALRIFFFCLHVDNQQTTDEACRSLAFIACKQFTKKKDRSSHSLQNSMKLFEKHGRVTQTLWPRHVSLYRFMELNIVHGLPLSRHINIITHNRVKQQTKFTTQRRDTCLPSVLFKFIQYLPRSAAHIRYKVVVRFVWSVTQCCMCATIPSKILIELMWQRLIAIRLFCSVF